MKLDLDYIKKELVDWVQPLVKLSSSFFSVEQYTKVGLFTIYPIHFLAGIVVMPWFTFIYLLLTIGALLIFFPLVIGIGFIITTIENNYKNVGVKIKNIFYKK